MNDLLPPCGRCFTVLQSVLFSLLRPILLLTATEELVQTCCRSPPCITPGFISSGSAAFSCTLAIADKFSSGNDPVHSRPLVGDAYFPWGRIISSQLHRSDWLIFRASRDL
ncbi:hypothetical protein BDM02DRAFT_3117335 [Thelephora ganbajun]|uniref:Uncharacterized protein n=1 Tax=Thelephora ganbajun TaxID=370292 RepID=A0ACB6ZC31_THEGA|nr:hypothetical protein BDM02DRAFT_3117335 [Thelephora ganbajun]